MNLAHFTLYDDYILINNVTEIKEFSDRFFILKINDVLYQITGENLVLKDVSTDNHSIRINGTVHKLEKKDKEIKKNKSFIKRLFS